MNAVTFSKCKIPKSFNMNNVLVALLHNSTNYQTALQCLDFITQLPTTEVQLSHVFTAPLEQSLAAHSLGTAVQRLSDKKGLAVVFFV